MNSARIERSIEELKQALKENLELLREAIDKVRSGDFKYIKVVLATLRVLVHEKGTNKPLLLKLADVQKFIPMVYIDSPRGLKTISLREHLSDLYFVSGTESIRLTNADFIEKYSQQEGLSHEDWSIEKEIIFPNKGILIGGLPPKIRKGIILGEHIYRAGSELLKQMR